MEIATHHTHDSGRPVNFQLYLSRLKDVAAHARWLEYILQELEWLLPLQTDPILNAEAYISQAKHEKEKSLKAKLRLILNKTHEGPQATNYEDKLAELDDLREIIRIKGSSLPGHTKYQEDLDELEEINRKQLLIQQEIRERLEDLGPSPNENTSNLRNLQNATTRSIGEIIDSIWSPPAQLQISLHLWLKRKQKILPEVLEISQQKNGPIREILRNFLASQKDLLDLRQKMLKGYELTRKTRAQRILFGHEKLTNADVKSMMIEIRNVRQADSIPEITNALSGLWVLIQIKSLLMLNFRLSEGAGPLNVLVQRSLDEIDKIIDEMYRGQIFSILQSSVKRPPIMPSNAVDQFPRNMHRMRTMSSSGSVQLSTPRQRLRSMSLEITSSYMCSASLCPLVQEESKTQRDLEQENIVGDRSLLSKSFPTQRKIDPSEEAGNESLQKSDQSSEFPEEPQAHNNRDASGDSIAGVGVDKIIPKETSARSQKSKAHTSKERRDEQVMVLKIVRNMEKKDPKLKGLLNEFMTFRQWGLLVPIKDGMADVKWFSGQILDSVYKHREDFHASEPFESCVEEVVGMLGSWVETIAQQAQTAIERTNFGSPASMKLRNLIMGAMYGNIKYEDLEKKLAATESKQTEYLKIIQDLEEEKRDLLRVKKQHESDSVARDEANDKIAALEVDLEQAYSARDELVWRCFDRDRQLREVDGQLKKLEMDRTEYMKRLTSSQINADTLTAERLELLKANSAWEASVRSLSVELGGVRAQRDALEKEVEELKRKEALTSKKLALAEDATSNLESLKAVNELCLQEVTESREELHSVLDQMTYAFEKGNIELAELRNELGRYKGREARQLARRNTLKSKGEKGVELPQLTKELTDDELDDVDEAAGLKSDAFKSEPNRPKHENRQRSSTVMTVNPSAMLISDPGSESNPGKENKNSQEGAEIRLETNVDVGTQTEPGEETRSRNNLQTEAIRMMKARRLKEEADRQKGSNDRDRGKFAQIWKDHYSTGTTDMSSIEPGFSFSSASTPILSLPQSFARSGRVARLRQNQPDNAIGSSTHPGQTRKNASNPTGPIESNLSSQSDLDFKSLNGIRRARPYIARRSPSHEKEGLPRKGNSARYKIHISDYGIGVKIMFLATVVAFCLFLSAYFALAHEKNKWIQANEYNRQQTLIELARRAANNYWVLSLYSHNPWVEANTVHGRWY